MKCCAKRPNRGLRVCQCPGSIVAFGGEHQQIREILSLRFAALSDRRHQQLIFKRENTA